jgi:hypothetical protein
MRPHWIAYRSTSILYHLIRNIGERLVLPYCLKYMKTLAENSTSDVRHVLHASWLTPWFTYLVIQLLTWATENTAMSPACQHALLYLCPCVLVERHAYSQEHNLGWAVTMPWLVERFCEVAWGALSNYCGLSRRAIPSSSQLESDCAAETEPRGTATLLSCILSVVVKSLSEKYLSSCCPYHSPVRMQHNVSKPRIIHQ